MLYMVYWKVKPQAGSIIVTPLGVNCLLLMVRDVKRTRRLRAKVMKMCS